MNFKIFLSNKKRGQSKAKRSIEESPNYWDLA